MGKYLGKFKANQTLYFDYDSDFIDTYKPEGKYGEDYDFARKGTVYTARELNDDEKFDVCNIILEPNKGFHIYFENIDDLYSCEYLDEIKDNKQVNTNKHCKIEWIPCQKQLPDCFEDVLVTYIDQRGYSYTANARINAKGEWKYNYGVDSSRKVVAWAEYPTPYIEE